MNLAPFVWDQKLFTLINGLGRDAVDYLCAWPTHFGDPLLMPLAVFIFMLIWDQKNVFKKSIVLLATACSASFASTLLKSMIHRPRPYVFYEHMIHEGTFRIHALFGLLERESSMPSGHTTVFFAGAVLLNLIYKGKLWPLYLCGAFIGFTRVYVGVHFPSDILAGALLGILIGRLMHRLFSRITHD